MRMQQAGAAIPALNVALRRVEWRSVDKAGKVGEGSVSLTGDEVNVDLAVIDSVLLVGRVVPWHREGCYAEKRRSERRSESRGA